MKVLLLFATVLPFIASIIILNDGEHLHNTDITDPKVVFAVKGINELFQSKGDPRPRVAENVFPATVKVVSGAIYRSVIIVSGGDSPSVAPYVRALAEGEEIVLLSDPDIQKAVPFVESKYNADTNNLYYRKVTGAGKVTQQVVSGTIYRFYDLKFADSSCLKSDVKNNPKLLASCKVTKNPKQIDKCFSTVYWNKKGAKTYTVQKIKCD